jgi:hypothetical protein
MDKIIQLIPFDTELIALTETGIAYRCRLNDSVPAWRVIQYVPPTVPKSE